MPYAATMGKPDAGSIDSVTILATVRVSARRTGARGYETFFERPVSPLVAE